MEYPVKLTSKDKAKAELAKYVQRIHDHIDSGGKVGFDWHDYIGQHQVYVTIVLDYHKRGLIAPRSPKD